MSYLLGTYALAKAGQIKGFSSTNFLPPANEVCKRLCFYTCLSVVLFMGGLHPGVCIQAGWADPPPHHLILGDTVNERAVRILLECIVVPLKIIFPCLTDCLLSQEIRWSLTFLHITAILCHEVGFVGN